MERLGLASVDVGAFSLSDDPGELSGVVVDIGHHMGTTRMATDPAHGVVDSNCTVHGVQNLHVASCSVFPTSGVSNPTFTMLALSVRLADHLALRAYGTGVTIPSAGLGRPGTTTTALGFGCSAIAGLNTRRESLGLLAAAVELGIRHFDVAVLGTGPATRRRSLATSSPRQTSPARSPRSAGSLLPPPTACRARRTKALVRAALRKVPGLYGAVRSRATASVQGRQFDPEQIRQSLETSLRGC